MSPLFSIPSAASRARSFSPRVSVAILVASVAWLSGLGAHSEESGESAGAPAPAAVDSEVVAAYPAVEIAAIPLAQRSLAPAPVTSPPPISRPAEATAEAVLPDVSAPPPGRIVEPVARPPVPEAAAPGRSAPVRQARDEEPDVVPAIARGTLQPGETLGRALRRQGLSPRVVHHISRAMRPHFDFRRAQPGHGYRARVDESGHLIDFRYSVDPETSFRVEPDGEGFRAYEEEAVLESRVHRISGVVETSLYAAIRAEGETSRLANDFAAIFAWDMDFSRGAQPGDEFQILYERLVRVDLEEPVYVRPGRILAARYQGERGDFDAFLYEDRSGRAGYYRADGSSVERAFLASPLEYGQITSHYTSARAHPILKITRPHYGIDYAAPEGTPIWAVADGKVIYRGWGGSFGNLVKIRHASGYVSYYSHLSRFAEDLRSGQKVRQKQVLGYVGKTGLATGPHVCFRVARDGRYVNPLSIKSPSGHSIPDEEWVAFRIVRDSHLSELGATTLAVAAGEAL